MMNLKLMKKKNNEQIKKKRKSNLFSSNSHSVHIKSKQGGHHKIKNQSTFKNKQNLLIFIITIPVMKMIKKTKFQKLKRISKFMEPK